MSPVLVADEAIARVDELDLEPIVFKMMHPDHEEGLTLEEADRAVDRYRKFLKLCAMYPDRPIVPTAEIDHVWHTHILDTAKYRYDCDRVFGRFLDHFPYLGLRGDDDAARLAASFADTQDLYMTHFGEALGGAQQACGENCGGSLCENPACSGNSCNGVPQPPSDRLPCEHITDAGHCTDCIGEALSRMRPRPLR